MNVFLYTKNMVDFLPFLKPREEGWVPPKPIFLGREAHFYSGVAMFIIASALLVVFCVMFAKRGVLLRRLYCLCWGLFVYALRRFCVKNALHRN